MVGLLNNILGENKTGGLMGRIMGSYDTSLSPQQENVFQVWKQVYAPQDTGEDYDLRGAFMAGLKPDPKTGHWPDTFKKPNHPTFSNESMYAPLRPDLAGHWVGDTYQPPVIERRRTKGQ